MALNYSDLSTILAQAPTQGLRYAGTGGNLLTALTSGLQSYSGLKGMQEQRAAQEAKEKAAAERQAQLDELERMKTMAGIGKTQAETGKLGIETGLMPQKFGLEQDKFGLEKQKFAEDVRQFGIEDATKRYIAEQQRKGMEGQGLGGAGTETLQREFAKNLAKDMGEFQKAQVQAQSTSKTISSIRDKINKDPEIVGGLSGTKAWLGKYGGKLGQRLGGLSESQRQQRGEIVGDILAASNRLIGNVTKAGVSGLNTLAEVERNLGSLTPNSSAEEIEGAMRSLERLDAEFQEATKAGIQGGLQTFNRLVETGQFTPETKTEKKLATQPQSFDELWESI